MSLPLQQGATAGLTPPLSAPGARGLGGLLVPPLVEPLDVAVAPEDAVAGLQSARQQAEEVGGQVAPPVVDLPHDDVSGP